MRRIVSWFSCGAASAVATKISLGNGDPSVDFVIANCEIREEHPDNLRFLRDCEDWYQRKIVILGNDQYDRSTDEVYRKTRYLVGPKGARCTTELKRMVRKDFQRPDDILVLGFTAEETKRLDRFLEQNAECHEVRAPLIERGLTKADCLAMIERAGIKLPAMYRLGYRNNNCIGCVKGGAGYWNKIRRDFPERFAEMAKIERELGRTICKIEGNEGGKRWSKRVFLDELPPDQGRYPDEPDISCGIFCATAEDEISPIRTNETGEK
jgi:3'-phosphoadenosine 5'-phosphosulfate sulfotransferase (PAPS reductase)/FAD synthetase